MSPPSGPASLAGDRLLPTVTAAAQPRWAVRLLGAVEAVGHGQCIARWPSRAVAALLARLAMAPDRAHAREELVELLWPGVPLAVGRNRLRQALSTLRALLEPPGPHAAPVIDADRQAIRVVPGAIGCDALRFEDAVRAGRLERARALYRGELMPAFYDDWVADERMRLAALHDRIGDAPAAPPPAATDVPAPPQDAAPPPVGLPSYWTRAFGVELPATRLRTLICAQRLVTVHGPGGSGKTRLAVEVARSLREPRAWPVDDQTTAPFERVVFVALVDCTTAAQALDAVVDALHVDGSGDQRARILAALGGRHCLLVLDNLEQLVDAIGDELAALLTKIPGLHLLVTSRRRLEVDGEVAFELDGLPLPAAQAALADAAANAAVSLFVDRARAARADFRLGTRNVSAIVSLVRLLGGMPLAIELAASRARGLTPQELLRRLREDAGTPMLDLLARSVARASPAARHASMRHVVAWSWDQLDPRQAELLGVMSVFSAPARLQAVVAVSGLADGVAQAAIDQLHDASLVQRHAEGDEPARFALLQPVREFAAAQCGAHAARAARRRLRQWLIDTARQAMKVTPTAMSREAVHVHAAIASAAADGAGQQALELALALRRFWDTDDLPSSYLPALETALADVDDAALRADALELLSYGRGIAGYAAEALAHAEAALSLRLDDRRRSLALTRWAWAAYYAGQYDAALDPALHEAVRLARRRGDLEAEALALRMQCVLASNLRLDFAGSERLATESQALWERLGNRRMAQGRLLERAVMWAWLGRNEQAIEVLQDCERLAAAEGDWVAFVLAARQLGRVFVRVRRWDDAAAALRRSLQAAWQRHYSQAVATALLHLPDALVMQPGQVETAARVHGFAQGRWSRLYGALNPIETREVRRTARLLRRHLGAGRAEALRVDGVGMPITDVVHLALGEAAG